MNKKNGLFFFRMDDAIGYRYSICSEFFFEQVIVYSLFKNEITENSSINLLKRHAKTTQANTSC